MEIISAVPDSSIPSIGASVLESCENLNPAGGATANSMVDLSSAVAALNCISASPKLVWAIAPKFLFVGLILAVIDEISLFFIDSGI